MREVWLHNMARSDENSSEGTTGRALTNAPAITGDLTIAKCITACKNGGYSHAGAEYANECCKLSEQEYR